MGEARRRIQQGLPSRNKKNNKKIKAPETKIFSWLPITPEQENLFIRLTIRGAWIGIGCLIALWIVVRFVGPAAGWWVPADLK